jgi:hypothetical protein
VVNFSGRRDRKMMISLTLEGLLTLSHSPYRPLLGLAALETRRRA